MFLQGQQRRGSALPSFSGDVPSAAPPQAEQPGMSLFAPQAVNGHRQASATEELDLEPPSARCGAHLWRSARAQHCIRLQHCRW